MLCLECGHNGLSKDAKNCPHCNAPLSSQIGDKLPLGTLLQNGRYHLDFPIGRGGFGITYRAYDFRLEKVRVIKEFFPKDYARRTDHTCDVIVDGLGRASYRKALNRFLKEARILATLQTENVVRVYDCFEEFNTAYIVMDMVDGRTLRKLLDERPEHCFHPDEVEKIIDHMVDALEVVHLNGIFHLDISPDNVMQTKSGKIVLIDFGAARRSLRTSGSEGGALQFKHAYAPLEIVAGTSVGPESDLFELAMMAHELLCGQLPPSYAQRAATEDLWQPQLQDERWRKAVARALHLRQDMRPSSVREWWNLYRRHGIVFGDRKGKE